MSRNLSELADDQEVAEAGSPLAPYLNRELSWLEFDARVLALAEDASLPLLERAKFLAIFSQNLDEFFQVRVAGLKAQLEAGVGVRSADGLTPAEQLASIRTQVLGLIERQGELFTKEIQPALTDGGVEICEWPCLNEADRAHLSEVFDEQIFPVLTPLAVDPAHPFPYISNLSLNLAAVVRDPGAGEHRFARLKVPPLFPRFLPLPDGSRFVPIEQVIAAHVQALFPGMDLVSTSPFRVTRDAELPIEEDEADDLLQASESGLERRLRMNSGVRLEVDRSMSRQVRNLLAAELELEDSDVYVVRGLLDLGGLWELHGLDRPELKDAPAPSCTQPRLLGGGSEGEGPDIFEVLKQGSVLVHHPYDSFSTSVEEFLSQAASDPAVLAIKHTLYRTSGPRNPIVDTLIRAAESGKQVVTLVELKARFDEAANIERARALEKAGVHVVYGLVGLKTHAKIALVVRQEEGRIRRYCHVGTGNYNPATASIYEDVGILSASPELGAELTDLFNHLTGCSRQQGYRRLLVAPTMLRPALLDLIREEMKSRDGRIVIKVNSLADPEIIDELYAASQAGVEVDLIVRGICCLRPGVPGLSERIRVRSIVGRFLEHSRIFRFGGGAREPRLFIGSADLMGRNLDQRVEVALEVEEAELKRRLDEILEVNLSDDSLAWQLGPDGDWNRVPRRRGVETHERLLELACARAHQGSSAEDELHSL